MSKYESQANKILKTFSDGMISPDDWRHIAFYVVQNGRLSQRFVLDNVIFFGDHVKDLDNRYWRYDNEPLF